MKKFCVLIISFFLLALPSSSAFAATDGFYSLSEVPQVWDGTDANRLKAVSADYGYTYGDESAFTYTLPWTFLFYGQSFNQINVDTNGNIWFAAAGGASHSFNLAATGRGPVISAWNNDLSSYYYGGAFVQHKTDPERVVIEWQAETYTEEGYSRINDCEVVIFPSGTIRYDYKTFSSQFGADFGTGISNGDGVRSLSVSASYGAPFNLSGRSFSFADALAPVLTLSTLADQSVTSSPVLSISGETSDSVSGVKNVTINGTVVAVEATGTFSYALPLSAGVNAVTTVVTDNAGNQTTDTRTIIFDETAATIALVLSGSGTGTVTSSPSGISCGNTCSATFAAGTSVTLTASPDAGSTFVGWSGGGCKGTQPCTITPSGVSAVFAIFAPTPSPVSQPENQWIPLGPGGVWASVVALDPHAPQTVYAGSSNAGVFRSGDGGASWSDISSNLPPYSGIETLLAVYDAGRQQTILYAGTVDGIFRSDDGGAHWSQKNVNYSEAAYEDTPAAMIADPASPQVLYAARVYGNHLVYKSLNGGDTWMPLSVSTVLPYDRAAALTIDTTTSPATLYLGATASGVHISRDGGSSWSQASSGLPVDSYGYVGAVSRLIVDTTTAPSTVYATVFGAETINYKGTVNGDGLMNWARYAPPGLPSGAVVTAINTARNPATLYATGGGLHRSTDGGANWQSVHGPFADVEPYQLTVEGRQNGWDTLYSPTGLGIYKSADSGSTWSMTGNDIKATSVLAFAVDPGNPTVFYAELSSNKLMKSEDSGQSWKETGLNPPWSGNAPETLLVDPTTTPSTIYAGTYTGVYRSTDGGASWHDFNSGLSTYYHKDINKIIRDPRTNDIYAAGYSSGLFRLERDAAGGGAWQPLLYWNLYDFAVDPSDSANVYGGFDAVYKSGNGGAGWSLLVDGWPGTDYGFADAYSLAIDPFNSGFVYATSWDGLYRWDNVAMNWTRIMPNLGPVSPAQTGIPLFDPAVAGTLYLATDLGVHKSSDGGATWQTLSGADRVYHDGYRPSPLMLDPVDPKILYATMRYKGSGVLRFIQVP